jgi:FkbM family methyltransferase
MKPICAMDHPELYVPHAGWFSHEPGDEVARFLSEGWFEYKEQAFLWLSLRPGDTFFDGGAHVGLYSVVAARAMNNTSGTLVAVEPHPGSASLLDHNLRANGIKSAILRQSALFSRSVPVTLHAGRPGKSAYSSIRPIDDAQDTIPVEAITLDDLLKSRVQLAKIDVEGAEMEALAGAADSIRCGRLPLLIVECTEANLARFGATTESLFTALRQNGYTVCQFDAQTCQLVVRDYAGPIGYDNLFAAQHLEEVNQRLSAATEASRRIATDILTRGAAAEELYLQSSQLDHVQQRADAAERKASEARTAVHESERRAEEARKRADEAAQSADAAFRGLGEANWRAEQAEHRAEAAERRASDARSAVQESERRTEEARKRADEAAQSTDAAFRSQGEANWRADEAEKRAESAALRVAEAHHAAEESERRAEAARQAAAQAEARTAAAEQRAGEARRQSEDLLQSAGLALERLGAADLRVAESENSAHQSRDAVLHYAELASHMRLRLNEMLGSRYLRAGWKLGLAKRPAWVGMNGEPAPAALVETRPETEMMRALRHLNEKKLQPRAVLDIGAGKGYWSILAGGYFKEAKFYLLDPLTENEPDLRRLCEEDSRQHYILTGVGEEPGDRKIHVAADPDSSTMLLFPGDDDGRLRTLSVTTVDRLLEEGRIEPPDLVKIDVQGMELQVLRGSQKLFEHTAVFIIEVNLYVFMPGCPRVHEIVQFMADRGYTLFDLAGSLRRPFEDDLGQLDLVLVAEKSPLIASSRWV